MAIANHHELIIIHRDIIEHVQPPKKNIMAIANKHVCLLLLSIIVDHC